MKNPTRLRTTLTLAAPVAVSLLLAIPLAGQASTTRGFSLGVHLQGASLTVEGSDNYGSAGAGLRVGYGVNRYLALQLEGDWVSVEVEDADPLSGTWSLGHAELGARLHFPNELRSWVPFLDVAVGSRIVDLTGARLGALELGTIDFSGGAFSLGGGLYVYFKQTFALEAGLKFTSGKFTDIDVGGFSIGNLDIDANSTRVKVGVAWWP